jgi:DNA-binding HxlR family transcriptional regulator
MARLVTTGKGRTETPRLVGAEETNDLPLGFGSTSLRELHATSARSAARELSADRMTPKVQGLFLRFRDQATVLHTELMASLGPSLPGSAEAEAEANLRVARSVFGKWCIEILVFLFARNDTRFNEIRRALPGITSDALSRKLHGLEKIGLVERRVGIGRPPAVSYSLTEDGRTLARMGEPVFLFLRLRSVPSEAGRR